MKEIKDKKKKKKEKKKKEKEPKGKKLAENRDPREFLMEVVRYLLLCFKLNS